MMVQVTRDLFARLGLNVDMQSMDWGTLVGRRALDKPSAEGGWNSFCTSWTGLQCADRRLLDPVRCATT